MTHRVDVPRHSLHVTHAFGGEEVVQACRVDHYGLNKPPDCFSRGNAYLIQNVNENKFKPKKEGVLIN